MIGSELLELRVRSFELAPCSELRFDLRYNTGSSGSKSQQQTKAGQQQQHSGNILPLITVKLDPRDGKAVSADWLGFSTNTVTASPSDSLTFRLGCTRELHSIALFTSSGCFVTVEGPAPVVNRCLPLAFFDLDTSLRPKLGGTIENAWPHWRKQLLHLHEVLHSQRLVAFEASKVNPFENVEARIGPRVLVCSARPGSGKTTVCQMLVNLAVRDGFQPLFVAADTSGTSLIGQPGCFAAGFVDHGVDPTEGGAHYPSVQVAVPLEDCERSKRAEPWEFSINALMGMAEARTYNVPSCSSGGMIVDTDAVDDFQSEDDLQRLISVIDTCDIRCVIVIGSENLRNTLRCQLTSNISHQDGGDALDGGDGAQGGGTSGASGLEAAFGLPQHSSGGGAGGRDKHSKLYQTSSSDACVVRHGGVDVTLLNFPVVDGAAEAAASSSIPQQQLATQARWFRYFFGTPTSPLSSWRHSVKVSESKWCVLRALTSNSYGGILPLLGAGQEQKSIFKAEAQTVDVALRFSNHGSTKGGGGGGGGFRHNNPLSSMMMGGGKSNQQNNNKVMVAAMLRCDDINDKTCGAEIIGFVGVTNVNGKDGTVEFVAPSKNLPREKFVFAVVHSSCQP